MSVASIWMTFVRHIGLGPSQTVVIYKSILIASRFMQNDNDDTKSECKRTKHRGKSVKLYIAIIRKLKSSTIVNEMLCC